MPKENRPLWLDEFDPYTIPIGKRIVFLGMTGSGKSEAMKNVIFAMRHDCFGAFAHSPSETAQQFWADFIPDSFIYKEESLDRLTVVLKKQKILAAYLKKLVKTGYITKQEAARRGHIIVVLDDLMFLGKKFFNEKVIKEIVTMGRHYFMTVLISLQYSKGVDPLLRTQIDFALIWKTPKIGERKKLNEEWVGYFKSYQAFDKVFDRVTGDFSCLVVKTSPGGSNEIEQNVFYWKPELKGEFQIGTEAYRLYHKQLVEEKKRHRKIDVKSSRKRVKVM